VKSLSKEAVKMINKNLVGRCGHYCGACSIYRACEDGRELLEVMRKSCPPERNLHCRGVRPWTKLADLTITAKYAAVWMQKGLSFATSATSLKKVDAKNGKD